MIRRKNISICISSLAISLLFMSPATVKAQFMKKKMKEHMVDTVPFFRGFAVSADLLGAGMLLMSDYGSVEGALRINLKDRYFPVFEAGYAESDKADAGTHVSYKTQAPYGRIGIDFNLLKNKHDIYRLYAGVRYAYTRYQFDIASPAVKDPVWGDNVDFSTQGVDAYCHWAEVVFSADASIWGPLHLGWSVRYRNRLVSNEGELGKSWYVPGYGKSGKSNFGGTFNVIIDI